MRILIGVFHGRVRREKDWGTLGITLKSENPDPGQREEYHSKAFGNKPKLL